MRFGIGRKDASDAPALDIDLKATLAPYTLGVPTQRPEQDGPPPSAFAVPDQLRPEPHPETETVRELPPAARASLRARFDAARRLDR